MFLISAFCSRLELEKDKPWFDHSGSWNKCVCRCRTSHSLQQQKRMSLENDIWSYHCNCFAEFYWTPIAANCRAVCFIGTRYIFAAIDISKFQIVSKTSLYWWPPFFCIRFPSLRWNVLNAEICMGFLEVTKLDYIHCKKMHSRVLKVKQWIVFFSKSKHDRLIHFIWWTMFAALCDVN